jgi:NAD(P)-dependent dehydrogenase (short-subunit alcohol dehydrogenase family)
VVKRVIQDGGICHVPCFHETELKHFPHKDDPRVRIVMGTDLRDEPAVQRLYHGLPGLWASIHIAGAFVYSPIADSTLTTYSDMMDMNARTCFLCCREAVKRMRAAPEFGAGRAGRGRIVNVAARPALEPRSGANMTAYTMSKAAVAALTLALAEEVVAEGIFVNAVAPSVMDTPANRRDMPKADFSTWAGVDEVAATIAFLASPQNLATRGGVVPVYGRA